MGKGACVVVSAVFILAACVFSDCTRASRDTRSGDNTRPTLAQLNCDLGRRLSAQNSPIAKLIAPTSSYDSRVTLKP